MKVLTHLWLRNAIQVSPLVNNFITHCYYGWTLYLKVSIGNGNVWIRWNRGSQVQACLCTLMLHAKDCSAHHRILQVSVRYNIKLIIQLRSLKVCEFCLVRLKSPNLQGPEWYPYFDSYYLGNFILWLSHKKAVYWYLQCEVKGVPVLYVPHVVN